MLTFAQTGDLLSLFGEVRSQSAEEWAGSIALPADVAQFYREIGPVDCVIPAAGNPIDMPALDALWEIQAGYRWHGHTGERLKDWSNDWLVVAQEGGNPYIFDIATKSVFFDRVGKPWRPEQIFPDIFVMAAALATIGRVYDEAGDARFTEDFSETLEFRALKAQRLTELLGSDSAARRYFEITG